MKIKDLQIDEKIKRDLLLVLKELFILDKGDRFTELGELLEEIESKYGKEMLTNVESAEDYLALVNDKVND